MTDICPECGTSKVAVVRKIERLEGPKHRRRIHVDTAVMLHKGMFVSCGCGWPAKVIGKIYSPPSILVEPTGIMFLGRPGDDLFWRPEPKKP